MPLNILLVDDEPDAGELFRQKFRREIKAGKVNLTVTQSGAEALEVLTELHSHKPLLILSDVNMPGMTGFELLPKIKGKYPDLKVIMVSAYGGHGNYESDAKRLGADDFFPKPINFNDLKDRFLD